MLQRMLDGLAATPTIWNALRWIAEGGYGNHYRAIREILQPFDDTVRRFLDFGCGTGNFAGAFPAERYVGLDPARGYISFAARSRRGAFGVMDGSAVGLQDSSFDGALVDGVFHHLPDDLVRQCAAELRRVLRPQSTLLVLEDVPPPTIWNVPGHLMHRLDRGDNIRSDAEYRSLWEAWFTVRQEYYMRSGICDYRVYVLEPIP
ncbi:MAG: class I SAM-dependent methyltransferase [Herpetosiphon sp.]